MILLLPWPPSVNQYWRHVVLKTKKGLRKRTLLSMEGRHFRTEAVRTIRKQFPVHGVINEPVRVEMHLFPPDRRKRDVDNYSKGVLDALTYAKVWTDDYLVDDLHIIRRRQPVPGGAVTLRISTYANKEERDFGPEFSRHPDQHGTE
jgi:crossover junction endodeoxyribonuclease RusA